MFGLIVYKHSPVTLKIPKVKCARSAHFFEKRYPSIKTANFPIKNFQLGTYISINNSQYGTLP